MMWSYSKNPVLAGATDQKKPERTREETLAKAAQLKLKRERDGSQAMKEHQAARQETLAKTARLRAERLARDANASPAKAAPLPKRSAAKKN